MRQLQGDDADENQPRTAEHQAAVAMVEELSEGQRMTLGADKAYNTADFVFEMARLGVTPHVSCRSGWISRWQPLRIKWCGSPKCCLLRRRHAGRLSHEMIPVRQTKSAVS